MQSFVLEEISSVLVSILLVFVLLTAADQSGFQNQQILHQNKTECQSSV